MFHDEEHARARSLSEDTLVLPPASRNQRILYTVLECQPLFDSSDMTIAEWVRVAQTIERHYEQYHGFVVIHGTDTMAFAASMLSFMLENLQKTVILTGAQVPIHALWSDGRENLLGALLMAGQYVIPEVCLFFQNQLFRGNRTTKVDARRFAAFCSPNLLPLATVGADITRPLSRTGQRKLPGSTVNRELVRKVDGKAGLVVHSSMEQDVGLLRLYPGIPAALVRAFLQPPLKGVVMETFGSGNGPTKPDLLQELRVAAERGLVIVNCTHCLQGAVTTDYAAGMAMAGAGVISGFDMTSEAALAKLSYVLGQPGLSLDDRKELLTKDLRGEMTPPSVEECRPSLQGNTLGRGVSWLLSLSGSQEADALRNALVPSLACVAAHAGDLEALQALVELGSDLGLVDLHGQTPLHAAARGGHTEAVTMLLQRGVDVNTRDTDGFSPLLLAVRGRHPGVIGLLREAGASLSTQELEEAGTELCRQRQPGTWQWWPFYRAWRVRLVPRPHAQSVQPGSERLCLGPGLWMCVGSQAQALWGLCGGHLAHPSGGSCECELGGAGCTEVTRPSGPFPAAPPPSCHPAFAQAGPSSRHPLPISLPPAPSFWSLKSPPPGSPPTPGQACCPCLTL
nr:60 kDa lysophospholipase isoform X6 [Gorilla gorilla gorilla]